MPGISVPHRLWWATAAAVLLAATACGDDPSQPTWERTASPTVVDQTDDVVVVDGTLADGTYWSTVARVSGTGDLVFRVVKARFGEFCEAWAAERGRDMGCLNDYEVDTYPDAHVAMAATAMVSVAVADGPGTNLAITASTLEQLLAGTSPDHPAEYDWTAFPFLVQVRDGFVIDAQQFWIP